MDDNCGEWVERIGVASGCGEQEVGVASASGWNIWVWLLGVVVRRYIDFLILLIPTPLVSILFYSSIPTFCSFFKMFFVVVIIIIMLYFIPTSGPPIKITAFSARLSRCTMLEDIHIVVGGAW